MSVSEPWSVGVAVGAGLPGCSDIGAGTGAVPAVVGTAPGVAGAWLVDRGASDEPTGGVSSAARDRDPAARSLAASIPPTASGRAARPRPSTRELNQARPATTSRREIETRRMATSMGKRSRARRRSSGQRSVAKARAQVVRPDLGGRLDGPPAGRRTQGREERLIDAQQAVLGGAGATRPGCARDRRRRRASGAPAGHRRRA